VHQAVLDSGKKETGCTIHHVIATVDTGPIILQKTCPVCENDTVTTLQSKVQALEGQALLEILDRICEMYHN